MTLLRKLPGNPNRMRFENAVVIEEGPIVCARLGRDRGEDSSFDYSSDRLSVSAIVRKKEDSVHCQDAAAIFISENLAAIGVFDGFKDAGTILSERMADIFLELMKEKGKGSIIERAYLMLRSMALPPEARMPGGTTATVSIVLPDGGIYAEAAGDSPAYRIREGWAERILEYRYGPKKRPVGEMTAEEFFATRNLVSNPVDLARFDPERVMIYGGILSGQGESVLLATDGLTKNLRILTDPATGLVTDASGNVPVSGIVRGLESASSIVRAVGEAVMEAWMEREELSPDGWALSPVEDDLAVIALKMRLQ